MDTTSKIQQNILLINAINPSNFGGMTPLVKSPSESNSFLLDTENIENMSLVEKKSPTKDFDFFNKLNTLSKDSKRALEVDSTTKDDEGRIEVIVLDSPPPVVGIWSTIYIQLPNMPREEVDHVSVYMVTDIGEESVSCKTTGGNSLAIKALPPKVGPCAFTVRSQGGHRREAEFVVEVYGNNPEVSFCETGTDWPVTVAFKPMERCVYLAFNHHVSKFTQDGDFVKLILRDKSAYINDLAVDPRRSRLVLGVSGWKDTRGYKVRFQEVRLYSMTGTHIWSTGRNQPLLFGAPILHMAFSEGGNVIVAGHKGVDMCHKSTGTTESKFKLEELITPSRVCATPDGGCAIAEATEGTVQVYDKEWKLKVKVPIVDLDKKRVRGVSGLAVDSSGNILVTSCEKEEFFLYDAKGQLISVIESDWDCPKWPLDLTTSNDGYVFVADHGHACAKKYKYM